VDAHLIAQIVTILGIIYVWWHLRTCLQTLQVTVDAQKTAIEAQKASIEAVEVQLKAQSTVLQDFERVYRTMKLAVDTFSDPAALQREQAFRERVVRDTAALLEGQARQFTEQHKETVEQLNIANKTTAGLTILIGRALPFIPTDERVKLIEAADLPIEFKGTLKALAEDAPSHFVLLSGSVRTRSALTVAALQSISADLAASPNRMAARQAQQPQQ
jgi:hypothetical protein